MPIKLAYSLFKKLKKDYNYRTFTFYFMSNNGKCKSKKITCSYSSFIKLLESVINNGYAGFGNVGKMVVICSITKTVTKKSSAIDKHIMNTRNSFGLIEDFAFVEEIEGEPNFVNFVTDISISQDYDISFKTLEGDILSFRYLWDTEGYLKKMQQYCNDKYVGTVKVKHMSEDID